MKTTQEKTWFSPDSSSQLYDWQICSIEVFCRPAYLAKSISIGCEEVLSCHVIHHWKHSCMSIPIMSTYIPSILFWLCKRPSWVPLHKDLPNTLDTNHHGHNRVCFHICSNNIMGHWCIAPYHEGNHSPILSSYVSYEGSVPKFLFNRKSRCYNCKQTNIIQFMVLGMGDVLSCHLRTPKAAYHENVKHRQLPCSHIFFQRTSIPLL